MKKKKIAELVSLILNPLFVILLLILLGIEKSNLGENNLIYFTIFALILNGLFPSVLVFYFIQKGLVLDDVLDNKKVLKNRPFFLGWGTIIFLLETVLVYFLNKPQPLFSILVALFLTTLLLFLITLYKKISLHVTEITVFCLVILFLFGYSFWPVLFLIPMSIWARLVLKRHTKKQIGAAFGLALILTSLVFYYYRFIS